MNIPLPLWGYYLLHQPSLTPEPNSECQNIQDWHAWEFTSFLRHERVMDYFHIIGHGRVISKWPPPFFIISVTIVQIILFLLFTYTNLVDELFEILEFNPWVDEGKNPFLDSDDPLVFNAGQNESRCGVTSLTASFIRTGNISSSTLCFRYSSIINRNPTFTMVLQPQSSEDFWERDRIRLIFCCCSC